MRPKVCINGNRAASELFRQHHRAIIAQGARGEGPLVDRLLALQSADAAGLCQSDDLQAFFEDIEAQVAAASAARSLFLTAADLVHWRGRILPMLVEPAVMSASLLFPVEEVLRASPFLRPYAKEVRSLLAEADFQPGDRRYRTELVDGRLRLAGERADTLRALAGLAHEIGHCIAEAGQIARTAAELAVSEALAHEFEERCVASYLEAHGTAVDVVAWSSYQRRIDALNLSFFAIEKALLFGGSVIPVYSAGGEVFRESLFSMPGYQAIYAYASLQRLTKLTAAAGGLNDADAP